MARGSTVFADALDYMRAQYRSDGSGSTLQCLLP